MPVETSTVVSEARFERGSGDNACRRRTIAASVALALVAGTVVCFWPTTRLGFLLYEDPASVSQHPMISQGLSWPGFKWAFTSIVTCNWQPLTSLSHMLDCQLWGLDSGKHHLVNVCIHAVNVLLLFLVLRRMTGTVWRSAFVAALFGWHPMHVESVTWISERKDVLSAFFFLLTIGAYTEYARRRAPLHSPAGRSLLAADLESDRLSTYPPIHLPTALTWYFLALVCFALGLMSKPNIVTLPFVLLLLDFWPLGRVDLNSGVRIFNWKLLVLEKLPFLALSVADCVITFVEQKAYGSLPTLDMFPLPLRLENAVISYVTYLGKFFWPSDLGIFYLFPHSIPLWQAGGAALLLALISGGALWQVRKNPCVAVGWFWFLGILVPMIGLVQTGLQSRTDHHTYLAYIGLGILVAWGLPALVRNFFSTAPDVSRRQSKAEAGRSPTGAGGYAPFTFAAAVAALVGCWLGARNQLGYWQDSATLFAHTVEVTRDNESAHNMLASALLQDGRREEAISEFQETLKITPYYPTLRSRAFENLGILAMQQRQLDEAMALFAEALKLNPNAPGAHFNLGAVYGQRGELEKAAAEFERVIAIAPGNDIELNDADLQGRVARGLIRCGKGQEALEHCEQLAKIHPTDPGFRSVLAGVCLMLNRPEEAIHDLREAVRQSPKNPSYLNQLAAVLASCADERLRNGLEAVELAERACTLSQNHNGAFLDTLGMAYAEANYFPEAIRAAEQARDLAVAVQDQRGAELVERKLELYRAGKPYHEELRVAVRQ